MNVDSASCDVSVRVSHKAGCPAGQIMNLSKFIQDDPWVFGVIMILGGPFVLLFGRKFFPWVTAGVVSLFLLLGSLVFCGLVGFMNTNVGLACSIAGSIAVGALAGWFVMKTVWIAVGILGVIGGFFLGSMIYGILLVLFKWEALWAMIGLCVLCAVTGGFLSFKFSKQVVLICTCLIGSYSFMRGWTYFFGGFPAEGDIFHSLKTQTPIAVTQTFWIYLSLFVVGFLTGMYY